MSGNSTVSLTLQIKGQQAAQEMKRISDQQVQATNKINTQWTQIGSAQAKFVNTARAGTRETLNTARAGDQLLRTNRLLEGVLRQQSIQTKLQNQLLRQQVSSAQQLVNSAKQVEQSTKRTHQSTQQTVSLWQKGSQVAGGLAGGFMAAKAVVTTPLERNRNFAATVFDATASITNGFSGMTAAQAKAANTELTGYAKDAVRKGHGTVEGVSEAAGILSASGNYDKISDLREPLIAVAKSAFAAGASEADVAKLVQQTKQFGIAPNRTQAALDRMIASGFAGGFELKDMAQFLPEVLSTATGAGFSGEKGLNTITTHLQLARKYTGTPGEAKTNIEDLYGLVSQKHFKDAIAKNIPVRAGDPTKIGKKGKTVFDLTQYLVNNKLKGIDTTDAIANLMNRELSTNKEYNKLNNDLSIALKNKNAEQAERIKQAIELVIKGQFGDIFHNKQSLSGISSIVTGMKNGSYQEIDSKSWNGLGSVNRVADIKGDNEFAQAGALQQETILGQVKLYESVNGKLGEFEKGLVGVMQNNQGLTAATIAATGALTVLAATAGGASLAGVLTRKASDLPPATSGLASKASGAAKTAGLVGAAYTGYQIFKPMDDAGYSLVSNLLAKVGIGSGGDRPDFVQQAIEQSKAQQASAEEKSNQLISEQQKQNALSQELINKMNTLIGVTGQSKPINFSGGLLGAISEHAATEEKRHGASNVPFYLQRH
ncbi:phage tail tape measure protein [Acinetobacter seifertii]|uniref:phage tail tape measure protein n=1 Tax=Acinetobacter seifertii TaxID=1530123 RepID=UPI0032B351F4